VIAVDTNILVYAHRKDSPFHQLAKERVAMLAEGPSAWAIPWPCLHEFVGVATHPRIYKPPTALKDALIQVDIWLESPSLVLLSESDRYWSSIRPILEEGHVVGPRVHDARIAALCSQHGVRELWSADRDFSRFPSITVINPLIG
jgi:toxin-antitoxin system PIN domain toxin